MPPVEPRAARASGPAAGPASEPQVPSVIEAVPGGDAEGAAAEKPVAETPVAKKPVAEKRPDSAAERPARADESAPADAFGAYPDASADLGVAGLTRRQARAQEKIRTASVPVISPDLEPSRPPVGAATTTDETALPAIFRAAA